MNATNDKDMERDMLHNIMAGWLKEQRRARRWSVLFKGAALVYVLFITVSFIFSGPGKKDAKPHTALIDIKGIIDSDGNNSQDSIATALRDAFESKGTRGVILRISSPGGYPVQASHVYNEIMRQRQEHPDIKVYAVCDEMCASAAYYIASAADDIYANQMSMVGSIGVLYDGFGFVDSMSKLGVERRRLVAGSKKAYMDPFSPVQPEARQELQAMLDSAHRQFISDVQAGRGKRLSSSPDIFSGRVWSGTEAKKLGLIDGFASSGEVARNVIGEEEVYDYTVRPSPIERLASRVGASASAKIMQLLGVSGSMQSKV